MRVIAGIFAVSVIAIMSVIPVQAEVVSTELLDKRLGTDGNLAKVASSGSYNDLANKPTIPTKTSELSNDSGYATTAQVNAKVSTAQGTANAGKGLVVDATSGNLTLTDIATQAELNSVANAKQNALSTAQLNAADSGITSAKVATYDGYASQIAGKQAALGYTAENQGNKATDTYTSGSTTQYPSIKVAETIAGKAVQGVSAGLGALSGLDTVGTDEIDNGAVTNAKLDAGVQASLKKADSALQAHQDISGKQDKATAVTHTANTAVGDASHPVYVTAAGVATKIDKVAAAATADSATSATKATQDASGNVITTTYATKNELGGKVASAQGTTNAKKVMATNSTGAVVPASITGAGSVSVTVADSGAITVSGTDTKYTLPVATASTLGGVKAGSNVTIAADGTISTHAQVTPGNGTVTIKQGGATKGTFTLNQTGNATVELTDNNTTYTASGTNGVSASVSGTVVNVSGTTATRDTVGVAKLGVIPVGTTGTSTATIWVE